MGRRDLQVQYATCHKGINQQAELASLEECADARNVWAPNGRVISRPGYVGAASYANLTTLGVTATYTDSLVIKENPIGTFTNTRDLSNLPVGGRWYLLFSSGSIRTDTLGFYIAVTNFNANATWAAVEYWNGSGWAPLYAPEGWTTEGKHLSIAGGAFGFSTPGDLSSVTVNGLTGYGLRFTIQGAALDATVLLSAANDPGNLKLRSFASEGQTLVTAPTLAVASFPFTKTYFAIASAYDSVLNRILVYRNAARLEISPISIGSTGGVTIPIMYAQDEPASIAVVPQFEEFYCSYNRIVTRHPAYPSASDPLLPFALVESDPGIMGAGAPYDVDQIIQLAAWPKAKYISFFGDRMWAANLSDSGDYSVRWSAPVPYYKVWPTVNIETLMEDDNSPITGLRGYHQNMTVFKEDSIWMMEDVGTTDLQLESFNPRRVVSGVGCVSNSSVAEVQGRLIILAEDGIYAYDGTPQIEKLSYRIQDTINAINPARRAFAVGVNLSQQNLYLLAVAVNGSNTNNLVIVWDYKNDSWWLWDNIEAQQWLLDEGADDKQRLYFMNSSLEIFETFIGDQDNGAAISSYVLTQRFDYNTSNRDAGDLKQRMRMVEVISTNDSRTVDVEVRANDEPNGTVGAIDYTDDAEKDWPALTWAVDTYTVQRRRRRRLMFYKDIDWCQVKVSHSTKNATFQLASVGCGFLPLGKR